MKRWLAALGLAAVAGTTMLSAASAESPGTQPAIVTPPAVPSPSGPRGDVPPGPRRHLEFRIAERLSVAETLVGIRSNQLDAWRDYTSALLALFEPPARPGPDADAGKAFAREEWMIRNITERAAKAATLEKAIATLKTTLSPDQLDRLAKLELEAAPRPGPGGPGRWGGPEIRRFGSNFGPGGPGGWPAGPRPFVPGMGFGQSPATDPAPGAPNDVAQPDPAPTPG